MVKYKIVKLYFQSPLHIGRGLGEAYDTAEKTMHSDTISGALTSVFCSIKRECNALEFMSKYNVSSAFPFMGNTCFLPKPLVKVNIGMQDEDEYQQKKKLKKIEYIETSIWLELISGKEVVIKKEQLSENGKFLFAHKAPDTLPYKDDLQQRVSVPRDGGESKPYFLDRRFFEKSAGLYFFLKTDVDTEQAICEVLNSLGTTGLGTDKSVGNGQFKFEIVDIELQLPDVVNKIMVLSLVCPRKDELTAEILQNSAYQLTQRGGFIAGTNNNQFRHLRKKSVYMFVEGSVFSTNQLIGKIENVRPAWNDSELHPVFRDGRAFCLPVNI
jgi:CRISPR-associated protein Csm4